MVEANAFLQLSTPAQLVSAAVAGLITSITPCVYPLIPITLALFGASSQKSYFRAFLLSSCYVLGIATMYTGLGIVCAATGTVFGTFLGNPIVIGVLAFFLISLAIYSLELIHFRFLSRVQSAASHIGGKGFTGAYLMGLVSGVVAAPCAGPILAVILLLAASTGDVAWGGTLLFVYSIALGTPYILLGTFSGLIKKLPRSGSWLNLVKFATAVALLVLVQTLSWPFIKGFFPEALLIDPPVVAGVLCFACALAYLSYRFDSKLTRLIAALLLTFCVSPMIVLQPAAHELTWNTSIESTLASAAKNQNLAMVDLYADWCTACKELEHKTFSNEQVKERLARLSLGRIDFTLPSEMSDKITAQYNVIGLPCLLFLKADGSEIPDSRVSGFMEVEEFLRHLALVESKK